LIIGVKSSSQQSFIQIERKTRGYRGKKQFTTIIHSKKLQNAGLSGYRAVYSNQSFKKNCKMLDYRGKSQFKEINHSNRAKNAGL
jgi:hypothetical protein